MFSPGRIHTLFLVGTARCAVRATFSGAASGQKAFAGGGMRSTHGGAGGDIAARCPYHFKNSAWMRPFRRELLLYFRPSLAQFGGRMTRRISRFLILALAEWLVAQTASGADAVEQALAKSAVLEGNVAYLQVGRVGSNLADEIRAAQSALAASNKIAGTVLDLRFADGDDLDSAKAAAGLFAQPELPLAILVNAETRGAAQTLALELRDARAGLIFKSVAGGTKTNSEIIEPAQLTIAVAIGAEDERALMKNPYAVPTPTDASAPAATNGLLPLVDYTSEADLVRAKIKDGDGAANPPPPQKTALQPPVIRDPVLARAVDLIKGLAIVRASRS
jgi:hypothetical protein